MPRKTDSNNPSDWIWIAEEDLKGIRILVECEAGFDLCRSKLAEVLEKILKAELIRTGWFLEKTHDLDRLLDVMVQRRSDLAAIVEPLCDALAEAYFVSRYPGFDLDDPDWPSLRAQVEQVGELLDEVKRRLPRS